MILALGLLVFLGFLYAVIKKESGKWTALLVVFMGLVLIDNGAPDREMDNHLKGIHAL